MTILNDRTRLTGLLNFQYSMIARKRTAGKASRAVIAMNEENNVEKNEALQEDEMLYDQFLDTRYVKQKREVLNKLWRKGLLTDKMVDDFAVTMDIVVSSGDLETRYYDLLRCLDSMARFETTGLR